MKKKKKEHKKKKNTALSTKNDTCSSPPSLESKAGISPSAEIFTSSEREVDYFRHIIDHGRRVSSYAHTFFLAFEPLHNLSHAWLRRLMLASKFHDVGAIDGEKAHHKNSYKRIMTDESLPIAPEDREYVALLARYHRKALPSNKHKEFANLSAKTQEKICQTASFLRMADALDYSHQGVVGKIEVHTAKGFVDIFCHSETDISVETQRLIKKSDLFERTFKRIIRCKQA